MAQPAVHKVPDLGKDASPSNDRPDGLLSTTSKESNDSEAFKVEIPADEIPGLREAITRQVEEQLRSGKLPGLNKTAAYESSAT